MDMQEALIKASGFYLTVNFNKQQAKDVIGNKHKALEFIERHKCFYDEVQAEFIILDFIIDLAKEFVLITTPAELIKTFDIKLRK